MIIKFSIENFKSICDKQTFSFVAEKDYEFLEEFYVVKKRSKRLLKVSCIYGANGSGKSVVLEGLITLVNAVNSSENIYLFYKPHFDSIKPTKFQIEFIADDMICQYSISFNKEAIVSEKLICDKTIIFKRDGNTSSETILNYKTSFIFTNQNTSKELTSVAKFFKNINYRDSHSDGTFSIQSDMPPELFVEKYQASFNQFAELMNEADIRIDNIKLVIEGNKIIPFCSYTVNGQEKLLSYEYESRGTKMYVQLLHIFIVMIQNNSIVIIDELESALHPLLVLHFIIQVLKHTKGKECQLLFTGHATELMNKKDIIRNDTVWFTEKNKNQMTELYRFVDIEGSYHGTLHSMYITGTLGAIPNLGL